MEFVTDNFGTIFEAAPFFKSDFFQIEEEVRILIKIFVFQSLYYIFASDAYEDVRHRTYRYCLLIANAFIALES